MFLLLIVSRGLVFTSDTTNFTSVLRRLPVSSPLYTKLEGSRAVSLLLDVSLIKMFAAFVIRVNSPIAILI